MKSFEDLTIADDYMFCSVMRDEKLCKKLLSIVLKGKIGKIEKIVYQLPIDPYIGAKSVRFDIMIEDEYGKVYDIEMQTTDQKNLPKRMRYYQCAIDSSLLNKGEDYNKLADTFIIFFCTFDYINKGLPIYTLKTVPTEISSYVFEDGVNKIIVNSKAAKKAEPELKDFLEYMNGNKPKTKFTEDIEKKVSMTKGDEDKRREYMLITSFEMDAKRVGREEGLEKGIEKGIEKGLKEGLKKGIKKGINEGIKKGIKKGMEEGISNTAKKLKKIGLEVEKISEATGLTIKEIEEL